MRHLAAAEATMRPLVATMSPLAAAEATMRPLAAAKAIRWLLKGG